MPPTLRCIPSKACVLSLALLASCLLIVLLSLRNKDQQQSSLQVSLHRSPRDTNGCLVVVSILNQDKMPIVFSLADMPWYIGGECMKITLVSGNGLLSPTPFILDSMPGLPVTLKPGEVKTKEVDLGVYYRDLRPALLSHDVDIIWEFTPRPRGMASHGPLVGHLRLPHLQNAALIGGHE